MMKIPYPADVRRANYIRSSSIFCLQTSKKYEPSSRMYSLTISASNSHNISKKVSNEKDDYITFMESRDIIIKALTESEEYAEIPWVTSWYKEILSHNLQGGKFVRGVMLLEAYRAFSASKFSPETNKLVFLMAWCIEMIQSFYLIHDDLVDEAVMRRNRPCWYLLNDNGTNAINDGVLVENGIYQILEKYFKNQSYYINVMELFHDIIFKTTMGQILDSRTSKNFRMKRNLEDFTPDLYRMINKYKAAYYTCLLPVRSAMYMAGVEDKEKIKQISEILLDLGDYFQRQDDFMDCFGDLTTIGKIGTDIQEGKCTWPLVTALKKVNDDQKSKLQKCYGTSELENVAAVKRIFEDVGVKEIYARDEENNYNNLITKIQKLPDNTSIEVLLNILKKLYKRTY